MAHYDDEPNPFQDESSSSYGVGSSLSTPSVERISFTPERSESSAVDSSQSTINNGFADDSSRTLPPVPTSPVSRAPRQTTGFKNEIDRYIHSGDDIELQIIDAVKTSDHSTTPYIVYVIRTGHIETRRRYSDFESLRSGLARLYPTLIVPPIPSKQSIGEYAVKQGKAKEDVNMIARRKRMLQVFLNRLARHPILSTEYVFHRFLAADVSWSEMLHSPPLSQLPKNILRAPAHDPLDTTSAAAYAALSSPSPTATLRQPDQRFLDSESFTNRFASHISGNMEKVSRRTMKRWSEFAHDNSELGAVLNGFSLSESGHLAAAIEKTGQAIDATYISTTRLLQDLAQTWTEPLHEYAQFSDIIKKLLQYRHQKHVQYEQTIDSLEAKREALEDLEKSEAEAQRLQEALAAAGVPPLNRSRSNGSGARPVSSASSSLSPGGGNRNRSLSAPQPPGSPGFSSPEDVGGELEDEDEEGGSETANESRRASRSVPEPLPPAPVTTSTRRSKGVGSGLLNALSHSIQGMMDVDPEAARRANISKTKDAISQLEDAQHLAAQDLKYASSTIQADLDRFQRQKVADIREMTLAMARIHRDWCKANMEAWIAAKAEIDAIPPHPNAAPPRENGPVASTSSAAAGAASPSLSSSP